MTYREVLEDLKANIQKAETLVEKLNAFDYNIEKNKTLAQNLAVENLEEHKIRLRLFQRYMDTLNVDPNVDTMGAEKFVLQEAMTKDIYYI